MIHKDIFLTIESMSDGLLFSEFELELVITLSKNDKVSFLFAVVALGELVLVTGETSDELGLACLTLSINFDSKLSASALVHHFNLKRGSNAAAVRKVSLSS